MKWEEQVQITLSKHLTVKKMINKTVAWEENKEKELVGLELEHHFRLSLWRLKKRIGYHL